MLTFGRSHASTSSFKNCSSSENLRECGSQKCTSFVFTWCMLTTTPLHNHLLVWTTTTLSGTHEYDLRKSITNPNRSAFTFKLTPNVQNHSSFQKFFSFVDRFIFSFRHSCAQYVFVSRWVYHSCLYFFSFNRLTRVRSILRVCLRVFCIPD